MKKLIRIILCLTCMLAFVGCGSENNEENFYETTLTFDKKGTITDAIVESFSEDYYSEDGLRAFFQEKISDYNSSNIGNGDVSLKELSVENGKAQAILEFDDADTYKSFYGASTFYGTVSDAYDKGYITETVLKSTSSNETISKVDLMKRSKDTIIIVSEPVRVCSPRKIVYTSANVEVIDEKNVRISSDSTGFAYILLK